jgi:hypothetical protein
MMNCNADGDLSVGASECTDEEPPEDKERNGIGRHPSEKGSEDSEVVGVDERAEVGGEIDGVIDLPDDDEGSAKYPEWSWDRVRTYVAIRRGDDYSDEQIRALAAQDVVMLEKFNGHHTYGSVEKGTLEAARRIKAVNTKVKILFYLNSMVHYAGYDANKDFKEEWALHNPKRDNELFKWREKFLSYDHTNLEFREWWIQRGIDMLAHDEIDGIFIDAICKTHHASLQRMKGRSWVEQHGAAYLATAKQLRERLTPGKILIGNVIRAGNGEDGNYRNLQYLDGSYVENWSDPQNVAMSIQLMAKAAKEGFLIMLNADMDHTDFGGIDSLDARYRLLNQSEFIDFPLGCFLLIVEPHSYFSYHAGVDANRRLTVFDNNRFQAITRKLGKPLGDYVDDGEGGFSREFEHLKVHVNVKTREGKLTVKDEFGGDEL